MHMSSWLEMPAGETMKRAFFHRWIIITKSLLWMGLAVCLPLSCGIYEQAEVGAPGDTGSVTFSVKWETSRMSADMQALDAPAAQPLAATDVCTAYGIDQVNLEVWRDGSTPTSTGVSATEECSAHTATLVGVPAQVPDLYVKLTTTPQGWEGESARFTLASGANQDLGEIVVDIPPMWSLAESIGIRSTNTNAPDVGMDDTGNAIAVWREGVNSIYASRFTPGAGWGAENAIAPADTLIQGSDHRLMTPLIAMVGNGDAIVTWREATYEINMDAWVTRILARRYTSSGGWEAADGLSNAVGSEADISDWNIAMDGSGNAVVVWSMNTKGATGTVYDIFASRYSTSSNSWASTRLTELTAGTDALYPHVAVAGDGSAMVVWETLTGNGGDIYAQRFDGAAWENTPAVIGTWRSSFNFLAEPRVAMDGSGSAIAIWRSREISRLGGGGISQIFEVISSNRYAGSIGAWGDTNSIVDIGDARNESGHLIAMNGAGNATACWNWVTFVGTTPTYGGNATRYDALSGQWDASAQSVGGCEDIGMDDSGNAIILYLTRSSAPIPIDVRALHYDASAFSWSDTVTNLNDFTGDDGPRVAVNGPGEAVAVGIQFGLYDRPYASLYQ